jgi:hypothetical protein
LRRQRAAATQLGMGAADFSEADVVRACVVPAEMGDRREISASSDDDRSHNRHPHPKAAASCRSPRLAVAY